MGSANQGGLTSAEGISYHQYLQTLCPSKHLFRTFEHTTSIKDQHGSENSNTKHVDGRWHSSVRHPEVGKKREALVKRLYGAQPPFKWTNPAFGGAKQLAGPPQCHGSFPSIKEPDTMRHLATMF